MGTTPFWKSKTLWVNAITLFVALLAMPNITEIIGADNVKWLVMAQSAANIFLRFITNTAISSTPGPSQGPPTTA